jgi:hypothetical protein
VIRLDRAGWLSLAFLLAVGCAMSPEESTGAQPESEAAQDEPAQVTEVAPPAPTAAGEPVERSLADLQLELSNNEAKLQALGVQLPVRTISGGDGALGAEKPEPAQERKPAADNVTPRDAGGATPKSEKRPSPAPSSREDADTKGKEGRRPKPKKSDTTSVPGGFAPPPPEEAKSTPLSPNEQPQLDAATRCAQVCSLSDITCELGVQICELAQRHADNEEYEQACVRATEDCDAAQEACDACTQ